MAKKTEQMVGTQTLSSVPARLAKMQPGKKVPILVLKRSHQAASGRPLWGHLHFLSPTTTASVCPEAGKAAPEGS